MPDVHEFEGRKYLLQSDVDVLVREKLSEAARRRREAETKVTELEAKVADYETKVGNVDALAGEVADLREQLASANSRYDRHSAIASTGITDPEIRDAVEWAYERAMKGKAGKEVVPLGDAVAAWKADPSTAPAAVRPFFEGLGATTATETKGEKDAAPAQQPGATGLPRTTTGKETLPPEGAELSIEAISAARTGEDVDRLIEQYRETFGRR